MNRFGVVRVAARRVRLVAAAAACGLCVLPVSSAGAQVIWSSGVPDAAERAIGAEAGVKLDRLAQRDDRSRVVIRFDRPLTEAEKAAFPGKGVTLLNPLGSYAYFATIEQGKTRGDEIAQTTPLKSVSAIEREWKLHRDLLNGVIQPWTVIEHKVVEHEESGPAVDAVVAVYVLFHPDVDLEGKATETLNEFGAHVRSYMRSVNGAVVEMRFSDINTLADRGIVQYIEPALPLFDTLNAENRVITQVDEVQAAPYGLDGSGVSVLIYDSGAGRASHDDFGGRMTVGASDTSGTSNHSTHVAGTVGGNGAASSGAERGMAPNVDLISFGFEQPGGLVQGFLYTDPGDLEADYTAAISMGAVISNNSIGSNTAPNGFPCSWEGDYGVTASLIDAIARGSLGDPFRIVWAAGNERGGFANCGSGFNTTGPPSNAKNSITVGALNSDDDSITSFTSFGPADDGRVRPVVSAPGCEIAGEGGVRSTSSSGDSSYTTFCGTSMAAPTVCGIGALIIQDYRVQYPSEPEMLNSTLKTILAHTAVDLGNPGPDNQSGYGSVRARDAIDFVRTGNLFEDSLSQGDTRAALVIVNPGDAEMKVTIAWDDAPGTPNVSPNLVNDLDLVVTSPSGVRHFPWTMVGGDPGAPAVRTVPNTLDNIEQVFVENPEAGAWMVEVVATDVPSGPQAFSLTASPFLVNCTDEGVVAFLGSEFQCVDTVNVRVSDCQLNLSDAAIDTVDVTVGVAGGASFVLTLTESAPEAAEFAGSFELGTDLLVNDGDTIEVTYEDADDGTGSPATVTDTAIIDCVAPAVTGVTIDEVMPRMATVTVTTDEPSTLEVFFGTDCVSPSDSSVSGALSTSHTLSLTGLQIDTAYAFSIGLADAAGNTASDDNAGNCYAFMTPDVPDFFTEQFADGDNDLSGFMTTFTPNGSNDFYETCSEPIVAFPVDPSGGDSVSLSDDDNESVQVGGGNSVLLYGVSYDSFFVGSNGYVTFGSGDTDTSESLGDHFDLPRISGLFDDLNPASGGNVSVLRLGDRVVVTYDNVPEFSSSNTNSFQIAMHHSGEISIAWLNIEVSDGLTGLSQGAGLNPDFFESDIASTGACGPRPPLAIGQNLSLAQGSAVEITLTGMDDGLPDPPAAVELFITSLPSQQLRDQSTNTAISAASLPYSLGTGPATVLYVPSGGFLGDDSFEFVANDGGVAPDGGESAPGVVSLTVSPSIDLPFVDMFVSGDFDPVNWTEIDGATVDDGAVAIGPPSAPYTMRLDGEPSGGDTITSGLMNLSAASMGSIRWEYQRTGNGNSPESGEDLVVEFIDASGAWIELDRQPGDGTDMTVFETVSMPLPAEAYHAGFRVRFRNSATSGEFDDWFIDNVNISASVACTSDVDGSGTVDFADLVAALSFFGASGGPGDADGNGSVNFSDLVFILFNFGPCG